MTRAHLGNVAGGMEPVAILKAPVQPLRQFFGDRGLARARHAHHDQRARHFGNAIVHEVAPASAALSTSQTVSPSDCARFAGRSSPASTRVRIACLSGPETWNSISRHELSAGSVNVTRGTKGATCALGTPVTQCVVSSIAG